MTRPVMFLHGWGLHGGIWDEVRGALGEAYRTHAPDLPGYGASLESGPYTAEALADAVAAQLDAPSVVCGWSMGGMVALALAARHPDKVRALALVATSPAFVSREGWDKGLAPEVLAGFAQGLQSDYRATLLRFLSLQARGGDAARGVIERLRATVFARGEPDAAVLASGLELLRTVDLRAAAAQVRQPALVVHGGYDTLCLPEAGVWLAETLPAARLALQPRASHAPFLSHPEWFLETLKAFLDEHAQ